MNNFMNYVQLVVETLAIYGFWEYIHPDVHFVPHVIKPYAVNTTCWQTIST